MSTFTCKMAETHLLRALSREATGRGHAAPARGGSGKPPWVPDKEVGDPSEAGEGQSLQDESEHWGNGRKQISRAAQENHQPTGLLTWRCEPPEGRVIGKARTIGMD